MSVTDEAVVCEDNAAETVKMVKLLASTIGTKKERAFLLAMSHTPRAERSGAGIDIRFAEIGYTELDLIHIAASILRTVQRRVQKAIPAPHCRDCQLAHLALLQAAVRAEHEINTVVGGPAKRMHA